MAKSRPGQLAGADSGGGGGVHFPVPPVSFAGANLAAARVARNAYFSDAANGATRLEPFQRDQNLAIILNPADGSHVLETYLPGNSGQAYDATQWIDRGSSSVTDAHIDSRIAAPARANNPSGAFAVARIPAGIVRESELLAAIANLEGGVTSAYDTLNKLADQVITNVTVQNGRIVLTKEGGGTETADATGLAKSDDEINVLIHAALQHAVQGNTETGIDVTYDAATNTFDFAVTGGGDDSGGGGITLAQALAAILAGDNVTIDRGTEGQITISSTETSSGSATYDSPIRVDHLDINAPVGREVYLTRDIHHPGPEHIFSAVLGELTPNNIHGNPAFVGVSTVDFSGEGGSVATADTSAFPAVLNAARIAGIYENRDELFFTVAVNKAISSDAPTHINIGYVNAGHAPSTSDRAALTQHGADVTIGGQTYRLMRTAGRLLTAYYDNAIRDGGTPTLFFSLEYPDGYIEADGSLDRGTTETAGDYRSLGSGKWEPRVVILGEHAEASAATLGMLKWDSGRLYRNSPVHHTAQQVTWRDFATADLPAGYRWRGAFSTAPLLSGIQVNDVFYVSSRNRFYRHSTVTRAVQWDLPDFLGQFASEALADVPVTKVGQRAYFGGKLQVVDTYTNRLPDTYEWLPVVPTRFEETVGASPAVLPVGSYDLAIVADDSGDSNVDFGSKRLLLSEVPAADRKFYIRLRSGDDVRVTMRYDPTTRTLVYSTNTLASFSMKVIGEN